MRISELIAHLQSLQSEHGDLECETILYAGRVAMQPPEVAYRKVLKGKERRPDFWWPMDGEYRKGEKVVRF